MHQASSIKHQEFNNPFRKQLRMLVLHYRYVYALSSSTVNHFPETSSDSIFSSLNLFYFACVHRTSGWQCEPELNELKFEFHCICFDCV